VRSRMCERCKKKQATLGVVRPQLSPPARPKPCLHQSSIQSPIHELFCPRKPLAERAPPPQDGTRKAQWCSGCAEPGAVNVTRRKCEKCDSRRAMSGQPLCQPCHTAGGGTLPAKRKKLELPVAEVAAKATAVISEKVAGKVLLHRETHTARKTERQRVRTPDSAPDGQGGRALTPAGLHTVTCDLSRLLSRWWRRPRRRARKVPRRARRRRWRRRRCALDPRALARDPAC
jgi:hypothetical protein